MRKQFRCAPWKRRHQFAIGAFAIYLLSAAWSLVGSKGSPVASLVAVLAPPADRQDASPGAPPPLLLTHVTIIDGTNAAPRPDGWVLVENRRVVRIGDGEPPSSPTRDTRVVDATGKFVIPGLWDMHTHPNEKESLSLNVAHGVTGVRVMWGNPPANAETSPRYHLDWRAQVDRHEVVGPKLVVASPILDGKYPLWEGSTAIATPEQGRAAVRAAKREGADFIKVYSMLSRDNFLAIADEAGKQGIPLAGHVPFEVPAREASEAGLRSIEHFFEVPEGCSSDEDRLRADRSKAAQQFLANLPGAPGHEELASLWEVSRSFDDRISATEDAARLESLCSTLVRNGTYVCPTISMLNPVNVKRDAGFDRGAKWMFETAMRMIPRMKRAGVMFLAGTDEPTNDIVPGAGLHEELKWLVKAGLTPLEALQTATLNPARFLGRMDSTGTIACDHDADLVLLDADPLANIENTRRLRAVILQGEYFDRARLDEMSRTALASYRVR